MSLGLSGLSQAMFGLQHNLLMSNAADECGTLHSRGNGVMDPEPINWKAFRFLLAVDHRSKGTKGCMTFSTTSDLLQPVHASEEFDRFG